MKKIKEKKILFLTTLIFLLAILIFNWSTNPINVHKNINSIVGTFYLVDQYFYYMNFLGEGISVVFILLALLIYRYSYALITGISLIFTSLTVNFLKYVVFPDAQRPQYVFKWVLHEPLKTVNDMELMILRSFPSGHSAQCFTIFFAFALFSRSKGMSMIWLFVAFSGAFSRVYLSQHWLKDILAGAFIGIFFSTLAWFIMYPVLNKNIKLNKGIRHFLIR
jgi:membrane-associated phospholipid phosphatase